MQKNKAVLNDKTCIQSLLRLADEPYLYINEIDAHRVIMDHCVEFMDQLREFYQNWKPETENNVHLPQKQVFSQPSIKGDFRLMPCILTDAKLKFVKVIGTNEEERHIQDKICVGKSLLIDYYDNNIYAILDVCALSSFRTAAISVLCFSQTVLTTEESCGLLGTGRIGFYTAYILHLWLGLSHFHVTDKNPKNFKRFVSLCHIYMPQVTITAQPLNELTKKTDIIFAATTSEVPLLNADNAKHLKFISSVGADADNLSELDSSLLKTHELVTDSLDSMCLGDMKRWVNQGLLTSEKVAPLTDFFHKKEKKSTPYLFVSTGIAVQDILVNSFVYNKINTDTTDH